MKTFVFSVSYFLILPIVIFFVSWKGFKIKRWSASVFAVLSPLVLFLLLFFC